jgi:hypothetical protein
MKLRFKDYQDDLTEIDGERSELMPYVQRLVVSDSPFELIDDNGKVEKSYRADELKGDEDGEG